MTKEPKWTKGSWGIETYAGSQWIGPMRKSGDGKIAHIVVAMEDHAEFKPSSKSASIANAHLIAAAPELYEWLEFILRDEAMVHYFSLTYPEAFKGAKAALSKALGEKT